MFCLSNNSLSKIVILSCYSLKKLFYGSLYWPLYQNREVNFLCAKPYLLQKKIGYAIISLHCNGPFLRKHNFFYKCFYFIDILSLGLPKCLLIFNYGSLLKTEFIFNYGIEILVKKWKNCQNFWKIYQKHEFVNCLDDIFLHFNAKFASFSHWFFVENKRKENK